MRQSTLLQNKIVERLSRHFSGVVKEWDVTKDATDAFSEPVYGPRLDVAVGPFNITEEDKVEKVNEIVMMFSENAPQRLKDIIASRNLHQNNNPRCTLAIEVVYSGSSKHILGDITNSSMMGLYGFVVANRSMFNKVSRIFEYSKIIKRVGKAPADLFSNVCVISNEDFLELL